MTLEQLRIVAQIAGTLGVIASLIFAAAFECLKISFHNHDTDTLSHTMDPLLRGLRGDPRYKSLFAKLGLPAPS
jgi:hypothetical protein